MPDFEREKVQKKSDLFPHLVLTPDIVKTTVNFAFDFRKEDWSLEVNLSV